MLARYLDALDEEVNVVCMQETHLHKRGSFVGEHIWSITRNHWDAICSYATRIGRERESNYAFKGYSGVATFFTSQTVPLSSQLRFPAELSRELSDILKLYNLPHFRKRRRRRRRQRRRRNTGGGGLASRGRARSRAVLVPFSQLNASLCARKGRGRLLLLLMLSGPSAPRGLHHLLGHGQFSSL